MPSSRAFLKIIAAGALLLATNRAHAEAEAPVGKSAPPRRAIHDRAEARAPAFELLATAGYGTHTGDVVNLELAPYGASFGIDLGYNWASGFRLGGYFFRSLGHRVVQRREPRFGNEYDFTADSSSFSGGLSLGWGVPLYGLILRYKLSLGVTAMQWDFHGGYSAVADLDNDSSPTSGFHFAPGAALLWPYGHFEAGVGFEYLAQIKDTIPSGFIGTLLIGVRL